MNTENHYQETDLGNISLNPRGEYNPEESYEYLDLVVLEGGSYVCLAENGATITGISPESGKTTQYWQVITIPGSLTPEYIAMHDRVVNLSEQVGADAEEVRTAEQNVSGMELNVTQMQEQTRQSAEAAEQSKDSSAGYAASADSSRQAAEESEQNVNAQVSGFDNHVAEKVGEAESDIEAARIAANKAIIAQQEQSVNEVARVGSEAISTAQAAAQTATEKAQAADTSEKNAAASETAAKLSETNATKMAEQVATDKEQVANDRTAVENAKQEMTESSAQIEKNTQGIADLKSDLANTKANLIEKINLNASNDEKTKRSLDALWKLNQGISYQFETDENRAYQKDVPTGAKLASLKQIGGKTIVWNQMLKSLKTGWIAETNVTATFGDETVFSSSVANCGIKANSALSLFKGHKYYMSLIAKRTDNVKTGYTFGGGSGQTFRQVLSFEDADINVYKKFSSINVCNDNIRDEIYIWNTTHPHGDFYVKNPVFIDLTLMFGAGNEPATVEEFEAMFPEDYYEYNEGTLLSMPCNEVVSANTSGDVLNTTTIPQVILDLDGYGDSVSDEVYNYVDFENKKYHKRVGKVDLGTLSWHSKESISKGFFASDVFNLARGVCFTNNYIAQTQSSGWDSWEDNVISHNDGYRGNSTGNALTNAFIIKDTSLSGKTDAEVKQYLSGIFCYYELAEEEIIDISDILTDDVLANLEVEAGGTLTFKNSNGDGYRIPVPNTEEYVVSLAEVGGVQ